MIADKPPKQGLREFEIAGQSSPAARPHVDHGDNRLFSALFQTHLTGDNREHGNMVVLKGFNSAALACPGCRASLTRRKAPDKMRLVKNPPGIDMENVRHRHVVKTFSPQ